MTSNRCWRAFIDTMALIIELFITYLPWAHIFIQQLSPAYYKHSLDSADLIDRLLQRSVVILNDFWFVSYARALSIQPSIASDPRWTLDNPGG